jgi:hypothetical protein
MDGGMDMKNLGDVAAFVTKDGSEIRELLAHRNSAIRNQSLAEGSVSAVLGQVPETAPDGQFPGGDILSHMGNRCARVPLGVATVLTSQPRWQGRQRDAGGLNDGLLLHNNSFSSGDGLKNVFQYCVVYAENCFKFFGARSCRAGQRHQILDWRHRFSPAGIVCADGPLAFNPEVPQEPRAMPFKRLVWVGSSTSV